ncbi:hypothetical protein CF123_20910 [Aeromonas veronii]|uniref:Transposase n=1 Tax=Aeromonas veronii TaxID=654 RepID=A0AAX2UN69_AERVE|nr:hypothetical protein CF123_20910 [Aeromonas veronii]
MMDISIDKYFHIKKCMKNAISALTKKIELRLNNAVRLQKSKLNVLSVMTLKLIITVEKYLRSKHCRY